MDLYMYSGSLFNSVDHEREQRRLSRDGECTCDHTGSESSWPAVVVDKGRFERPGVARFCLGHALIRPCPDFGCGAMAGYCHIEACGSCKPVSKAAEDMLMHIFTNVTDIY
jgi:hypothetical protein